MNILSPNTQAILLLTAPLLFGRTTSSVQTLSLKEYSLLARQLHEMGRQPEDLLGNDVQEILKACAAVIDPGRAEQLLDRGFVLSQVLEHWQARSIWVISRADASYPKRFRERLKDGAPSVLYGCGDVSLLNAGGLAVIGSRDVDSDGMRFTTDVGSLCGRSGVQVVSGGARGVDQAAMQSALDAGGCALGVLADSLGRAVLSQTWRAALADGRLLLISPYDPQASFNVGNAMGRNKLIYALSDAALVVASDLNKGGTWSGAVEQLDRRKLVPVYVRSDDASPGLADLRKRGALDWPAPADAESLLQLLPARSAMDAMRVAEIPAEPATTSPVVHVAPETQGQEAEPDSASTGQSVLFSEPASSIYSVPGVSVVKATRRRRRSA